MSHWQQVLIQPTVPLRQAIQILDAGRLQIVLVVDANGCLLGTVTDGDIRRGLLQGLGLDVPVTQIMNSHPTVASPSDDRERLLTLMQQRHLRQIPVLDATRRILNLCLLDELIQPTHLRDNWVVLMAGGLGSRLRPLTEDCPKPMLKVGNKPLLETILDNFIEQGFHRFYISVNYKSEMIKDYFRDGAHLGVEIRYLEENVRMGTAGALSLLPESPEQPFVVMNGDLLTKVSFAQLLDFHREHRAIATLCVREYDFQVPYGVVRLDEHRVVGIDEKPVQRFFVNAGIYVLQPESLDHIPKGVFFDMPTLFDQLIADGHGTAAFPVREYWLDIGHLADYDRANGEFSNVFA